MEQVHLMGVAFHVRWCLLALLLAVPTGAAAAGPVPETKPPEDIPFTSYLYATIICRAVALDEAAIVSFKGRGPDTVQHFSVTEVLAGDPAVREMVMHLDSSPKPYPRKGDRLIALATPVAPISHRLLKVLPDTSENRKAVVEALAVADRRRRVLDFTDVGARLDAEEKILRGIVADLARRLPEHPHLGAKAAGKARVVRCAQPAGVYLRIGEGLVPMEDWHCMRPAPEGDGIDLWVGFEGSPGKPSKQNGICIHSLLPTPAKEVTVVHTGQGPYQRLSYVLETPAGKAALVKEILAAIEAAGGAAEKLAKSPPIDVRAAIACILEHARKIGAGERVEEPLVAMTSRLNRAFDALTEAAKRQPLSAEDKAKLIPALIALLADETVVLDQQQCDGPVIGCHQRAYRLLVQLTGKNLPPAIPEHTEDLQHAETVVNPAPPPADEKAELAAFRRELAERARERQRRVAAWESWWKESSQGRPNSH